MSDIKKFINSSLVYLIGNVLTKAIAFLLIPLYTAYLNPEDFGKYDLNIAIITFLSGILFLDIWGCVLRFIFDFEDEKEKPITIGLVIFGLSTVIYTIFSLVLSVILNMDYVWLLILYGLMVNIKQFIGFTARGLGKNKIYAIAGVISSLIIILLNILFIAILKKSYEYLYIANIIGMLINLLIVGGNIKIIRYIDVGTIDRDTMKQMLRFSLPLSVNSAAFWFLGSFNKVVISYTLSLTQNGYYAIAFRFSSIIQLFTQCFQMAWQELTFSKASISDEERAVFYSKAVNEYIKFLSLATALAIPVVRVVFKYVVDDTYLEAIDYIPMSLVAVLISCFSSFFASILSTIKKNRYLSGTTIVGAIVNTVMILSLINMLGVHAANISLACGYLVMAILRYRYIVKYIDVHINLKAICMWILLLVISTYLYYMFGIIINLLWILVFICIVIVLYKQFINALLRRRL